ncbi:MAG: SGNH/GDSL hydrolase family protein [Pirellulaceae bacterium]|jgi:lysophospholipase L1-like esterase|nr:SGNH/GDSL hydrolase family protein [Pirellulaceae bacterium]
MAPPSDLTLLLIILFAPFLFGTSIYLFFFKRKLHRKANWSLLLQGNVLILLLLLSLVMATGEIYYRFIYDETDSFALTNSTNRWILRHYKYNSSNYRDNQDYTEKCPSGKTRITFIGDSFTAGHGVRDVNQRFANMIRQQHPDFDVQVLANNGWDTGHQLEMLTKLGDTDLQYVVLVYCLNDLSDIVPEYRQILDRIYAEEPGYLVYNSYFLNTLYYRWIAFADPDVKNFYQFTKKSYENEIWQKQQQRLAAMQTLVQEQGGKLLVVTFPFIHALGKDYVYRDVHQQLDKHWQTLNVPHLDLYDTYKEYAPEQLRVNQYDAHPNEGAHAMAASAISKFLVSQTDKPEPPPNPLEK